MDTDNSQQPTSVPSPVNSTIQAPQAPIWKTPVFIVLALIIFWPVGLFLMWRYAPWRKWVKGVLTFFFLLGAIPLLFIWGLLFGLKGYQFVDNTLHPRVANQSQNYICQPVDSQWGRCKNMKYKISFEYPLNWNYIDLRPEGIGFTPLKDNLLDNWVLGFEPSTNWKTEDDAKNFAKGFSGISNRQEINVNGLYATREERNYQNQLDLFAVIVNGKTTYQFNTFFYKLKDKGVSLSDKELKTIFDHMVNSFRVEQ